MAACPQNADAAPPLRPSVVRALGEASQVHCGRASKAAFRRAQIPSKLIFPHHDKQQHETGRMGFNIHDLRLLRDWESRGKRTALHRGVE